MQQRPNECGVLHFIGIGGIGMSGIAETLQALGYQVQGSDQADSSNVKRLRAKNIPVFVGHKADQIYAAHDEGSKHKPAAVIVSSAIKSDNPELKLAQDLRIPIVKRADMLAELMRLKSTIAVGGTHGKTTTTSLVGALLEAGGLDPTVINGGIVNSYGTNIRLGQGDWMVVEADESDGSFMRLPATISIITNIDPEHMDHYGSFEDLKNAFRVFADQVPFYGFSVLCTDHPIVQSLLPDLTNRTVVTYGFNSQAQIRAINIHQSGLGSRFDVVVTASLLDQEHDSHIEDIFLPMLGQHNIQNALASIAVAVKLKISPDAIKKGLSDFTGVKRRFTKTGIVNGITIIDDYGHHPVEIQAVLKAGRQAVHQNEGKVHAIVQPHRYSRLQNLFDEFCTCFNEADTVMVADVYAAGEDPLDGVNRSHLVEGLKSHGHKNVISLNHPDEIASWVSQLAQAGDYVIFLGAGSITNWAYALPDQLQNLFSASASSSSNPKRA
jgi:UDP-N-acetylmuramate--alanine ligase